MKNFTGFRFGQIHSEDLHLVVTSSSNRYVKNTQPGIKDYTTEVPGGNGSYLFGQTFSTQEFSISIAFDEVDEKTWRKISNLFSTDKPQDLVFNENPYKTYRAKLKSKPDFKTLCFTDRHTGKRTYKGEGTLNFICYFPFAFGFNKYIVRAADYYNCMMPETIIKHNRDPYSDDLPKFIEPTIKKHYNVEPNMRTPWKGGYPSIEQVQGGELYFNNPETNQKEMIDVRKYFSNIPEWQGAAQLLVSPTLDFDRELIYMPQYSKTNYYNMDTGLNRQNGVIGSRILVYNPGDLPVDFELKLGNLVSQYRANMKDGEKYTFRISRYNVQRLTIEQAVDWCGMKTYKEPDELEYKYGNRYFTILQNTISNMGKDWKKDSEDWNYGVQAQLLGKSHPRHTYYVEPIPREKLGDFIRLFYWQSNHIDDPDGFSAEAVNWEKGKAIADRYEELYKLCIDDEERFELYWKTLKEGILDCYKETNNKMIFGGGNANNMRFFNSDIEDGQSYAYDDFVNEYINQPPEYIRQMDGLNYGEFIFNIANYPQYYTYDYLDITSDDFDKITGCCCGCDIYPREEADESTIKPLFIDSEKRMVYNLNDPEWGKIDEPSVYDLNIWSKNNEDKVKNFFSYKPQKKIFNDNIKQGHWFKIPPGWSLIDISPVVDEKKWGGKRWLDARPFIWGNKDEAFDKHFNSVYEGAAREYLIDNCPRNVLELTWQKTDGTSINFFDFYNEDTYENREDFFGEKLSIYELENYLQFRRWYTSGSDVSSKNNNNSLTNYSYTIFNFTYQLTRKRIENAELKFLKKLDDWWRVNTLDINGNPEGTIDDWWWFANSYIWANFPPVYWAYADLLNSAQIKYTPLFY